MIRRIINLVLVATATVIVVAANQVSSKAVCERNFRALEKLVEGASRRN